MCLIIFKEKAEIQDQYPLTLNRYRDRLQKSWANTMMLYLYFQYVDTPCSRNRRAILIVEVQIIFWDGMGVKLNATI